MRCLIQWLHTLFQGLALVVIVSSSLLRYGPSCANWDNAEAKIDDAFVLGQKIVANAYEQVETLIYRRDELEVGEQERMERLATAFLLPPADYDYRALLKAVFATLELMANVKPRHVPEQICDPTIIDTRNGPLPPLDDPAMRKAFVLEWITPASNPLIWRVVRYPNPQGPPIAWPPLIDICGPNTLALTIFHSDMIIWCPGYWSELTQLEMPDEHTRGHDLSTSMGVNNLDVWAKFTLVATLLHELHHNLTAAPDQRLVTPLPFFGPLQPGQNTGYMSIAYAYAGTTALAEEVRVDPTPRKTLWRLYDNPDTIVLFAIAIWLKGNDWSAFFATSLTAVHA